MFFCINFDLTKIITGTKFVH